MVFLVLGNHEFYGLSRTEGLSLASKLENEDVLHGKLKILNRRRIDISSDVTILGCTLHSHIRPENQDYISTKVRDFQRIRHWTIRDHNEEHAGDIEWLRNEIKAIRSNEKQSSRKIIAVTHHAPIRRGGSRPEHEDNPQSDAFGTELIEPDTDFCDAKWWIFGHTHYSTSFSRSGVNLISNQRGYIISHKAEAQARWNYDATWQKLRLKLFRPMIVDSRSGKDQFDIGRCMKVAT